MAVVILILTNSCRMHSVFVISSHLFIAFKIFNAMVALHHFFRSLHNHCKKYSIETARLNHIKLRKISLNFKAPIVQFRLSIYLYIVIVCYYKTHMFDPQHLVKSNSEFSDKSITCWNLRIFQHFFFFFIFTAIQHRSQGPLRLGFFPNCNDQQSDNPDIFYQGTIMKKETKEIVETYTKKLWF